ncbi:hypothetical protein KCU95_g15212, partial [Aureobasidium melanogenum]
MTAATNRRNQTSSTVHKKHGRRSEANKSKKEKKYVTTNVVFKDKPDRVHKRAKSSPKSKKSGQGKSRLRREPSSSPPPRRSYTLADESNEVLNSYRSHVVDDADQMIASAYKDLIQKLDQTTLGPEALSTRIVHAVKAAQDMCTPFAKQAFRVQVKDDAGNIVEEKTAIIGQTVATFERLLHKQKDELESLWEKWEGVRQKIAATGAQILHDPKFPSQFGLEALNNRFNPLSRLNPEVENLRRLIKKESEKAHKELDQEAEDSVNKHKELTKMWASWLTDECN